MPERYSKDVVFWLVIIGGFLLMFDVLAANDVVVFLILVTGGTMVFAWLNLEKYWGKTVLGISSVLFILNLFSLSMVRGIIIIIIILLIYDYLRKEKSPTYVKPEIIIPEGEADGPLIQLDPLFKNKMFGDVKTEDRPYPWRDINIQSVYGNKVIDLSNTILVDEVAVISIKQIFGKIEVFVPYDVEVSVHHSTLYGNLEVLGHYEENIINETFLYQTEKYKERGSRVKIITWQLVGDIEVKRI